MDKVKFGVETSSELISNSIITDPIRVTKKNIIGSVYIFVNKETKKVYIGKTIENYNVRINKHYREAFNRNSKSYFYNALRKYGWDSFHRYLLFQTEKQINSEINKKDIDLVICEKEIEFIKLFDSNDSKKGYNLTVGGDGMSGFKHSEETKCKFSEDRKGEKHSNYGVSNRAGKKVKQFDLDGNFIEEFDSLSDAAASVDGKNSNISRCCSGVLNTYLSSIWIKSDDYTKDALLNKISKEKKRKEFGDNGKSKKVLQYKINGEFVKEFKNCSQASREIGCDSSLISGAANGKFRHGKKFIWIKKEDFSLQLLKEKIKINE